METKYYFDCQCSYEPYLKAENFANALAEKDQSITHIIFYIQSKKITSDLDKIFDFEKVKKMLKKKYMNSRNIPVIIESVKSFKKSTSNNHKQNLIFICFGLDSKELFKLENYYNVKYIIAIPWIRKLLNDWIDEFKPIPL